MDGYEICGLDQLVAEAIERGMDQRAAAGHDISQMGHVVTIMVGRLDDWLKDLAARGQVENDVHLEEGDLEWAGIAAFKRAYGIFQERGYRSRLLSAAFRSTAQWSEFVGGDVVITLGSNQLVIEDTLLQSLGADDFSF